MNGLELHPIDCPYCGETYQTLIDPSQGSGEYVEDCYVCCQPIVINLDLSDCEFPQLTSRREND